MDVEYLREKRLIIFECVVGSVLYGLDTPDSDTDVKGVFILPKEAYYGLGYVPQVNDETHDTVFYELKRFGELLSKSNPNVLEMLAVPDRHVIFKDELFDRFKPEVFLSRQCRNTFANYAMAQIKKARGLNKKIFNPVSERKMILDFCYVIEGQGSTSIVAWLEHRGYKQENCGLASIPHIPNLYALFYDAGGELEFEGIIRDDSSDDVALSSIPEGLFPEAVLYSNKEGYSKHCKDYKAYRKWVMNRNEARYINTLEHGKNYDAKNIMHTFRLLDMAEGILRDGRISVTSPNMDELLRIRSGEYSYDHLMQEAEVKLRSIDELYESSSLRDRPDPEEVNRLIFQVREEFYSR
jgi:uncharacterized protein